MPNTPNPMIPPQKQRANVSFRFSILIYCFVTYWKRGEEDEHFTE